MRIVKGVKILNPTIADVLKYLRMYFETGVGYAAVNTARCAFSIILPRAAHGQTIGEQYLVKWLCKSCHEQRPPQPRYDTFWSVEAVLKWTAPLVVTSPVRCEAILRRCGTSPVCLFYATETVVQLQ